MSDRIFGFDWDDTYLICALAVATRSFAGGYYQVFAPGPKEIEGAMRIISPQVSQKIRDAVLTEAHPTKEVAKDGGIRTPRLYDIEGSATWANKADHGIIVERPNNGSDTNVYIQKVRFAGRTGHRAKMTMQFNQSTHRFKALECGLPLTG